MSTFSISAALMGLPPDMGRAVAERLNQFSEKLMRERRLPLRDDSRLVWSLVTNNLPGGWDETKVMDELCLLQYLHQYTDYGARYKCTIPIVKNNIEQQVFAKSPYASAHAYEYVQKFVIPVYRIGAMLARHPNGDFPKVWPWIANQQDEQHEQGDLEEEESEEDEEEQRERELQEVAELVVAAVPEHHKDEIPEIFQETLEHIEAQKVLAAVAESIMHDE